MQRCLLSCLVILSFTSLVHASRSVVFLDQGININQRWDAPHNLRGFQFCSSLTTYSEETNRGRRIWQMSLCGDGLSSIENRYPSAGEYTNSRTYTFGTSGDSLETILIRKNIDGIEYGEHGNWVSNAIYDFDQSVIHRAYQVFGVDRRNQSKDAWVSVGPLLPTSALPGDNVEYFLIPK